MRHLYTLIAAMFVAPWSWLLLAVGQDRSVQAFADAQARGAFDTGDLVPPVICLAGAGLLLGLLATLRFSPLGVVLAGAGYAASYLALLFDPDDAIGLFPQNLSVAGRSVDLTAPVRTGTTLLLGTLMMVAAMSVGRWRRRPVAVEPEQQVMFAAPVTREQPQQLPQQPPERSQDEPADVEQSYPSESILVPEPEPVTRQASTPRSGNRFPNSSGSGSNNTDRWAGGSRSTWPYAQRPRDRSLDG